MPKEAAFIFCLAIIIFTSPYVLHAYGLTVAIVYVFLTLVLQKFLEKSPVRGTDD